MYSDADLSGGEGEKLITYLNSFSIFDEFADEESAGPRMTIFTQIWHETAFGLIFCGRESFREMYEFTEVYYSHVLPLQLASQ